MRLSALIFLTTILTACLPANDAPVSPATVTPTIAPSSTPTLLPSPEPPSRSTSDRPDDYEGFQIHFVYAIPSDGEDRSLDLNGQIEASAIAANFWLAEQTGGSQLRYRRRGRPRGGAHIRVPRRGDEISHAIGQAPESPLLRMMC